MATLQPPPAGLNLAVSAAVSAATRDAVSRHALQHKQPYSKQPQQPLPTPRSRTTGVGNEPDVPPPPPPSSYPPESLFSGSPWTLPPGDAEALDLSLGKPPSTADQEMDSAAAAVSGSSAGRGVDGDYDADGCDEKSDEEGEEDGEALEDAAGGEGGSGDGGGDDDDDGDDDGECEPDADTDANTDADIDGEAASWASPLPSSRDPTADGHVDDAQASAQQEEAAPATAASETGASGAGDGGGGALPTGAADLCADGDVGDATCTDAGADAGSCRVDSAEATQAASAMTGGVRALAPTPGTLPAPPPAPPPPPDTHRASPTGGKVSSTGAHNSISGATGASASPARNAMNPARARNMSVAGVGAAPGGSPSRHPRPSWAGSHDSSPPSTSGSISAAPSPGPGGGAAAAVAAAACGGGGGGGSGRRAPFEPASDLAALGAAIMTPLTASGSAHQLMAQASSSSVERTAAAKIHIEVSAGAQGLGLNVQGRGRVEAKPGAGQAGHVPGVRRGRSTMAAGGGGGAGGGGAVQLGVRQAASSSSVAAAVSPAVTTAAEGSQRPPQQSSALWSSARRLRMSLQRLHQQYQTYHANLLQAGEAEAQQQPLAVLQPQKSRRGGGGGTMHPPGPRSEASGTDKSLRRLRVSGHNPEATGPLGAGTVESRSAAGVVAAASGGSGGRPAPRQSRRTAFRRPHSAPTVRPSVDLMSSGLRVEPDTQLQLDLAAELSQGSLPVVRSVTCLAELDRAWESRWSQQQRPDGGYGDGAPRPLCAAKSLLASPRLGAKSCTTSGPRSPRSVRSVPGAVRDMDGAAEAAAGASSPGSPGSSPTSMALPRTALAAAAGPQAAVSPRPGRRPAAAAAHPVLLVASMAGASATAAEDPDLAEVVKNARRRAAVEKQKMRAAREVAAAAATRSGGGAVGVGVGIGGMSVRRRAAAATEPLTAAPPTEGRTASQKAKGFELLFQRQAEQWARTHRQMPPRRRLAPAVTKMVEKWFSLVDDDSSGLLETRELANALQAAGVPCSEDDLLELVSTIDVNRDGAVSLSEFLSFLLKELGAGKNLTTGEYELPSGGQLPFAAMIARLKRLRVLDDVMRGGKARNRYVELLYNRGALAAEIGLSEQVAAGLKAIPLPTEGGHAYDEANGGGRRSGRVRLQQLFQQYRQAQRRATEEGFVKGPAGAGEAGEAAGRGPAQQRQDDGNDEDSLLAGREGERPRARGREGGHGGGEDWLRASPDHAAKAAVGGDCDSDYDAVTAGFGERVSGVSYYPRYSPSVSMLQGACASQRASGDNLVVLPGPSGARGSGGGGGGADGADPSLLFQLTEVLLPLEESNISGVEGDGDGEGDGEGEGGSAGGGDESPSAFAAAPAAAAAAAAGGAPASPPRLLLPVISPLPPIKRPTTRAFQRALLDVRHSAPEYLLQRLGFVGPLEAAAAAAAAAGPISQHRSVTSPHGVRSLGGGAGGGGGTTAAHNAMPFRPIASTDPAGLPLGLEFSSSSVSSTSSASAAAADPVAASAAAAAKAATAATGAYYTSYGAGFTRYKRWSMYDIDPAAENPDYWQAKAAALLMRRTSRAVKGVPGAGVTTLSAATAAAAAAAAVADAARDIELYPAPPPPPAPASAPPTDSSAADSISSTSRQLLPAPSSHKQQQHPQQQPQPQHSSQPLEGTPSVGWHLPSLLLSGSGGGGGGGVRGAGYGGRSGPSSVASGGGAGGASPRRRVGCDEVPSPGSTSRFGRGGGAMQHRGLGAAALLRGSAAAGMLLPPGPPGGGGGGPGGGAPGSPMQYVIRQQHATNPRLAAEALRNRRPAPPPEWEEMARLQRTLSKSLSRSPSRSPTRSPQRSPSRSRSPSAQRSATMSPQRSPQRSPSWSPQAPASPQLQLRPPQRRRPSLPSAAGPPQQ